MAYYMLYNLSTLILKEKPQKRPKKKETSKEAKNHMNEVGKRNRDRVAAAIAYTCTSSAQLVRCAPKINKGQQKSGWLINKTMCGNFIRARLCEFSFRKLQSYIIGSDVRICVVSC